MADKSAIKVDASEINRLSSAFAAASKEVTEAGGLGPKRARAVQRKGWREFVKVARKKATVGAPGRRLKRQTAYQLKYFPGRYHRRKGYQTKPFEVKLKAGVFARKGAKTSSLAFKVGYFSNYVHSGTKWRKTRAGYDRGDIAGWEWLYKQQQSLVYDYRKIIDANLSRAFEDFVAEYMAHKNAGKPLIRNNLAKDWSVR